MPIVGAMLTGALFEKVRRVDGCKRRSVPAVLPPSAFEPSSRAPADRVGRNGTTRLDWEGWQIQTRAASTGAGEG